MIHRLQARRVPGVTISALLLGALFMGGCGKDSEPDLTLTPEMTNQLDANISRGAPVPPPAAPTGEVPPGAPAAAPAPPPAKPVMIPADGNVEATLTQMTRELRKWIVRNQRKPSSYEEFASSAKIEAPPPPPGKKYALSREMRIILVKR